VSNRRVFYDWTFAPPKSVSLVALIENPEVLKLHENAVVVALKEAERYAQARVRKDGSQEDRLTSNFAAALFRHDTSRSQDPHLHTHAVIFNATYDEKEGRWKALQTREMLKARRMVDAIYNAELCRGLHAMGYKIERRLDTYEIAGISRELVEKFSKRHMSIAEQALAMVASGMASAAELPKLRDRIAHEERARKIKDANKEVLRERWLGEMTPAERSAVLYARDLRARDIKAVPEPVGDAGVAVRFARDVIFERKSVVDAREVERVALMQTLGSGLGIGDVRAAMDKSGIVRESDSNLVTSVETLKAELDVVAAAKDGRETLSPMNARYDVAKSGLDGEQQVAVQTLCDSRDFVSVFRGAAGTGKSYTLKRLCDAAKEAGRPLVVMAPQTQQARDLAADGMPAITVASFLARREIEPGAVVLLDEAGQVSTKQLRDVFALVRGAGGRVILAGDTRQHGAVESSDALVAIERHAGITPAEIKTVRRQDPARAKTEEERTLIVKLRDAVIAAAEGLTGVSFRKLEGIGSIQQVDPEFVAHTAADAYLKARDQGKVVLAVSQTRAGASAVNDAVATGLAAAGSVQNSQQLECLVVRDLTTAERRDRAQYEVGSEVVFVRNYGANKRGEVGRVAHVDQFAVILEPRPGELKARRLSLNQAERWNIVDRRTLAIGVGTRLQLKTNGTTREGKPLVNGELVTVSKILEDGALRVRDLRGDFKTVEADKRLLNLGYCVTSYGSQGKTVDVVVLADSGSELATSQEQWYVSITRARERAVVVTHDKEDLMTRIGAKSARSLAMDLNLKPAAPPRARARASIASRLDEAQRYTRRMATVAGARVAKTVKQLWTHSIAP
jgi:conjugative relaxase-like TrwC/TraI family protein